MATAHQVLLAAIEGVLGPGSDVGRYLARAMDSNDPLDLLLAEAAFQDLDVSRKQAISARVNQDADREIRRRQARSG